MTSPKCECKDAKIACVLLNRAGLIVNVKVLCKNCNKLWDIKDGGEKMPDNDKTGPRERSPKPSEPKGGDKKGDC